MKSLLVTGGCGFIGSHTCISLLNKNYDLIVLDSNVNSSEKTLKKIIEIGNFQNKNYIERLSFKKGDIRDQSLIENIFLEANNNKRSIDAVIHFAGLKAVEESGNYPLNYWDNNVIGSISLFKAMKKHNCKTIVFSSSATLYGNSKQNLISEDEILQPSNTYGYTKLTVERILEDIYTSTHNEWRIANLRYFNPIGAHESGLIGEDPLNIPNNLFPFICRVAAGRISKLNIFGNDWNTKDGTCVRDYIHVMDLAEAHTAALDYLFQNEAKLINLNIGTGLGTSVLELVNSFMEANSCNIPYEFVQRRKGDVASTVANNKLALSILNWSPQRSIFDMCSDGWRWQQLNPNGY